MLEILEISYNTEIHHDYTTNVLNTKSTTSDIITYASWRKKRFKTNTTTPFSKRRVGKL